MKLKQTPPPKVAGLVLTDWRQREAVVADHRSRTPTGEVHQKFPIHRQIFPEIDKVTPPVVSAFAVVIAMIIIVIANGNWQVVSYDRGQET